MEKNAYFYYISYNVQHGETSTLRLIHQEQLAADVQRLGTKSRSKPASWSRALTDRRINLMYMF